ncbi:MAG: serine hydrolase [Cyanobacteriota bacterium]|nr:serine hydrolase [Cyanobacteriota bacterium]
MHLQNPPYQIPRQPTRRPVKRRVVKLRRRKPVKLSRLKYGNIFFLIIFLISISWTATIPFRNRRSPEPPVITPSPSLSPAYLPPPKVEEDLGFVYNVRHLPNQVYSYQLQGIVNEAVDLARRKGLPAESLSISLIDVTSNKTHRFAGYKNEQLRYPASVAKLFWMVGFYGAVEEGIVKNESDFHHHLKQTIEISNNDAASRILDAITDSKSGPRLAGEKLDNWLEKRKSINKFFQDAGYENIVLSSKNYPIYYLKNPGPVGRDVQLRDDSNKFLKNQVTTDHAARLMYEIYTRQAISTKFSTRMAYLLTRDLDPKAWKNDPSNGIKGFLGESLPTNIYFGSKVGYTSKSRQDVAFIRTMDDRAIYILAVFAEDPAYAKDEEIFPEISRYVFDKMRAMRKR